MQYQILLLVQRKLWRQVAIVNFTKCYNLLLQVVSKKLAEGDIKSIEGLVTKDIFPNLQKALALMSLSQREQIAINAEDIYFSFPYQVCIGHSYVVNII